MEDMRNKMNGIMKDIMDTAKDSVEREVNGIEPLNMLVIADSHYIGIADHVCPLIERKCTLALKLLQEVLDTVNNSGTTIDVIALMGDMVDNGNALGAKEDLLAIKETIKKTKVPVIVAPGNHDGPSEVLLEIFEDYEGVHNIKGYQIINFVDKYNEDESASRCWDKMEEHFSQTVQNKPIIVLQHNPIYPYIDRTYPYNIREWEKIAQYYSQKGVLLSISGHAHWGIPVNMKDGTGYLTCPALAESPHRYLIIKFDGYLYNVEEHKLLC